MAKSGKKSKKQKKKDDDEDWPVLVTEDLDLKY